MWHRPVTAVLRRLRFTGGFWEFEVSQSFIVKLSPPYMYRRKVLRNLLLHNTHLPSTFFMVTGLALRPRVWEKMVLREVFTSSEPLLASLPCRREA